MIKNQEQDLVRRWNRQMARQMRRNTRGPIRPLAAVGWLAPAPDPGEYVPLRELLLVVLRDQLGRFGPAATKLYGYRASLVPDGVQWGGPENLRLVKDLKLCPAPGGRGIRLDSRNAGLLELALALERRLHKPHRVQWFGGSTLQLPALWGGFRSSIARTLRGEGPELEKLSARFGIDEQVIFRKFERRFDGLHLFPLDWVSGQLTDAATVFAELGGFPRCQVIRSHCPAEELVGYCGAISFDLYHEGNRSIRRTYSRPNKKTRRSASSLGTNSEGPLRCG